MLVHNQLQYGSRFIKQCELFTSEILRQSNTFIHIDAAFFRIYTCRHIWAAKRKIKLFPTLQNPEKSAKHLRITDKWRKTRAQNGGRIFVLSRMNKAMNHWSP